MTFEKGNNEYQSRKRTKIYLKITPQVLADARGISRAAIYKAVSRGVFNPRDLVSITKYISNSVTNHSLSSLKRGWRF